MDDKHRGIISTVYGAEEFAYLLGTCLINYGSYISYGIYQHVKAPIGKRSNRLHSLDNGITTYETGDAVYEDQEPPAPRASSSFHRQKSPSDHITKTGVPNSKTRTQAPANRSDERATKRLRVFNEASPNPVPTAGTEQDEHDLQLRETIQAMKVDLSSTDSSVLDFASIAGLESVKIALEEFACFFLHFPHLTRNLRQRSTTGILLFGPQGTGKTLLVRSFALKYNLALYDIRASAIMSKFVGEAEKFTRALFATVRANAPAILMLDECDGLLCNPAADSMQSHHYRLFQNELKNQWSDLIYSHDEVIIIGATNKPHDIDLDGFGRRLSLKLHVDLPSEKGCQMILRGALERLRHQVQDDEFAALGSLCHDRGLSGYDIDCLVEAQLRRAIRGITVAECFVPMSWEDGIIMVPCAEDQEGAVKASWKNVSRDAEEVSYRPFDANDIRGAIGRARPTVDERMREKHTMYASQYGTDADL